MTNSWKEISPRRFGECTQKKSREEKKATDRLGHNSWHFGGCHGCCGTSLHTFVQQAV
jgi:hypothetical protein